jgi:molybdate transport system substrate-binding protein
MFLSRLNPRGSCRNRNGEKCAAVVIWLLLLPLRGRLVLDLIGRIVGAWLGISNREIKMRVATFVVAASVSLLTAYAADAQELRLFGGGHFQGSGEAVAEAFAAKTGIPTNYTPGNTGNGGMMRRIEAGEVMDVVVLNSDEMAEEAAAGHIKAGSYATFGRDRMGLAVPKGAPRPDISTPDKLKATLLAARAVGMQEPDPTGHSGKNILDILNGLGIFDEVRAKAVIIRRPTEELTAGTVDIAFWAYPELLEHDEVEVLGPAPAELGGFTDQAVGIPAGNMNDAQARAFVQFLISADARTVLCDHGLDPPNDICD